MRENALRMADSRVAKDASLAAVCRRSRGQGVGRPGSVSTARDARIPARRGRRSRAVLAAVLHIDDQWMQRAALTAGRTSGAIPGTCNRARLDCDRHAIRRDAATSFATGVVIGARHDRDELHRAIGATVERPAASAAWWQASLLSGLHDGLGGAAAEALEGSANSWSASRIVATLRFGKRPSISLRATGFPQTAAATAAVARAEQLRQPHRERRPARRCHPSPGHRGCGVT